MQFHLNGFRPGDPHVCEADARHQTAGATDGLPTQVDVLIVGCGPTGLTLAAQLAAFPDITTRIVEQKSGPLLVGQADGIACRTMEMFEAFGFADRVMQEAYWVNEFAFWKSDETGRGALVRSNRIQDVEDGLSEFPHVVLNQARVHDFYLDAMHNSPTRLAPDYAHRLLDLTIPADIPDAPVTARLERLDPEHQGEVETINARFVVGCDGAHSAVRRSLGRALHGDSANQAWGVMDVLAVTDFPDIRLKTAIQSAHDGSALIIPREGGYMFRIYIELDKLIDHERAAALNITAERLVAAAQRILHPYRLDVKEIAWWSVYEIGQRLCERFDDLPDDPAPSAHPRVFIAGDACHTHSPKAGQGMNVSMQDGFNLGWKLAAVLRGLAAPELLRTFSDERRAVAQELIDFDRELAAMFSAPPKNPTDGDSGGVDPAELQRYLTQHLRFTAGVETRYRPSIICAASTWQHLAAGLPIGKRFHSAPVIRLADARPLQIGYVAGADGRWRLYVFAPAENPSGPSSRLHAFCTFLTASSNSPIRHFTPSGADIDAVIDVRAIFQQSHRDLDLTAMPPLLLPGKGHYGLLDYEKMFCADRRPGQDIFDLRGIDREQGCIVIVRPDQYVAHILALDAYDALADFFNDFMLPASRL
ncbi:MAG TPA: FAD-binding monooxygenase [Stellaceae bacterium]|nr:FAD-binding monooxygenase [Stellaceae bacterium]